MTPLSGYSIPSMSEIAQLRGTNGYRMVSTFSGCGGSCLGFEMAGFEVVWASEFVEEARRTYAENHPGVPVDGRDIRNVTAEDILEATGLKRGELDVLEGSPPCASFSTAGKREKGWGKVKNYSDRAQRADDLFFEYARLLDGLQPRVFAAENVSGLVKGKAIGYFKEILTALRSCGYAVEAKVLDASWLGVPQARQRLIFVGVRNDLVDRYGIRPAHPRPSGRRWTIRDVLRIESGGVMHDMRGTFVGNSAGDVTDRAVPTILAKSSSHLYVVDPSQVTVDPETGQDITLNRYAIGDEWDKIRAEEFILMRRGSKDQIRYVSADEPAPTIAAHGLGNVHTYQAGVLLPPQTDTETGDDLKVSDYVTNDPETGQDITLDRYAIGAEWDKIRPGQSSEKYFQLVRPALGEPVGTITATGGGVGAASVTHPTQRRKFTLAELRILSSFPADFVLTGTYAQRWERIGRSVPPLMARAIAETIRDEILGRIDRAEG